MIHRTASLSVASAWLVLAGCAATPVSGFDNGSDAGSDAATSGGDGATGFKDGGGGGGSDSGGGGIAVIYAHTDTELFTMDVTTQQVLDIGAFDYAGGALDPITDLAVNSAGDVWVNTAAAIFTAKIPASPGKVVLTKVADFKVSASQRFYALGFAPAGVLGAGETLVAGDSLGDLYAVETSGATQALGSFGAGPNGGTYELSGDIVFYTQNGKARGLATVRLYGKSLPVSVSDIVAEIDVPAMTAAYQSKTPAPTLKKQFLGAGTGFGRLFGVAAWNDSIYAFSRSYVDTNKATVPAQLIRIDSAGKGTSLQSFPSISLGWDGAGVTTSAAVTVLPPN
jgi:hypothetical protein